MLMCPTCPHTVLNTGRPRLDLQDHVSSPISRGSSPTSRTRVGDAVARGSRRLASAGVDTPRLDAELLLAAGLGVKRAFLHARWYDVLSEEDLIGYETLIRRREAREPVAYLLGHKAFYDLDLFVDHNVLIPRPESEHIVEQAVAWGISQGLLPLRILDVGTGSGALAIAIVRQIDSAIVWATDVSIAALSTADRNLERYALDERVHLVCGDILSSLSGSFDIVVANLPYVPAVEIDSLAPEIWAYEPRLALDGGSGGTMVTERLLTQLPARLAAPGLALLEIDPRQAEDLKRSASVCFPDGEIGMLDDYAGQARVLRIETSAAVG